MESRRMRGKRIGGILCGGNRLESYRFIEENREEFGAWWRLRRLKIYPNAYYNYRKGRKKAYYFDRSIVASITDKNITSGLDVRTLQKAMDSQQIKAT